MADVEESDGHSTSNHSSSLDDSSTSGSTATNPISETSGEPELVSKETKHVQRSKFCFLLLLMAISAAAGILTYKWASNEEQQDFEDEVRLNCVFVL